MKFAPWWHRRKEPGSDISEARSAIDEANSRARRTESLLEEESMVADRFRTQRQTNGFAEVIESIFADSGGRKP